MLQINVSTGLIGGSASTDHLKTSYVHSWRVYVGNDPVWSIIPECLGGPFLRSDFKDYIDESDTVLAADKLVPGYGFEAWCNLPGRFTFYRATGLSEFQINVSVCSVAVMGTKYIRAAPLASDLVIFSETTTTLKVPHVYSELPIGNVLVV